MLRPRARLALTMAATAAILVLLLGHRPRLPGPAAQWRGDDIALTAAWAVAVACSVWITVVTGACNVALGARRPRLAALIACAAPHGIRRIAGIAIVGSTVVASSALPATAATDEPVVRAPAPATAPARAPRPLPRPAPHPQTASVHVVRPGDNLWLIARDTLVARGTSDPDDRAIAGYWRRVIATNGGGLRSGDANLIYPGEIITLPPPQ